jgi:hypothetical protein
MPTLAGLDAEYIRSLLNYDQQSGVLRWRSRTDIPKHLNNRHAGTEAGWIDRKGYIQIQIDGRSYFAHRIIWVWMTGAWPKDQIDHKNGKRGDNSWHNLREANNTQNAQNSKMRSFNSSGFKGVSRHRETGKWCSEIRAANVRTYLGSFDTPEEAYAVYCRAAERMHGEFARIHDPAQMRAEREAAE